MIRTLAAHIQLLVLDVDGVLTDGRLWFGADGEALKAFHVRDGVGIKAVLDAGIHVAIISGRDSAMVSRRAAELGIAHVYQGVTDKSATLTALMNRVQCTKDMAACVGDDTPDLSMMDLVALPVAVADAHADVRAKALLITQAVGGAGAVREVCDLLLAARQ